MAQDIGLALISGDRQLSLKKLAKAFGVKKATMADTSAAELGAMLKMAPEDILRAIGCELSPLPDTRKNFTKGMLPGLMRIDDGG